MERVAPPGAYKAADLIKPLRREPSGSATMTNGEAVGLVLIETNKLVPTLVIVNP